MFWTTSEGWKLMEKPEKVFWKSISPQKKPKKIEAIYRLKNTSDCIQIDPPGPGQILKFFEDF